MTRICLVEDDREIAKNLVLLLRSEGFAVTHAPTREEAFAAAEEHKFDLALIDIALPDGNGFTVYTKIKETQDIPVIFLTASGDETSVVTGLNMGADDYITKPFRPRELIARIGAALRKNGRLGAVFERRGEEERQRGFSFRVRVPFTAGVCQQSQEYYYQGETAGRIVGCSGGICQ